MSEPSFGGRCPQQGRGSRRWPSTGSAARGLLSHLSACVRPDGPGRGARPRGPWMGATGEPSPSAPTASSPRSGRVPRKGGCVGTQRTRDKARCPLGPPAPNAIRMKHMHTCHSHLEMPQGSSPPPGDDARVPDQEDPQCFPLPTRMCACVSVHTPTPTHRTAWHVGRPRPCPLRPLPEPDTPQGCPDGKAAGGRQKSAVSCPPSLRSLLAPWGRRGTT